MIDRRMVLTGIVFTVIFITVTLWLQIGAGLSSLGKGKQPVTLVQDERVTDTLESKTGVVVKDFVVAESGKLFGMMIGIPGKPRLVLSRGLYESFGPDALEYVVLHETGHYQLWHTVKETIVGLVLLILGLLAIKKYPRVTFSIFLGLLFGWMMIALGRLHEHQADRYALDRMTNPEGMIEATERFKEIAPAWRFTMIGKLVNRGIPYNDRVKAAQTELQKRSQ